MKNLNLLYLLVGYAKVLWIVQNAAKYDFARYRSYPYSRKRASESSSGDEQNSSQRSSLPSL